MPLDAPVTRTSLDAIAALFLVSNRAAKSLRLRHFRIVSNDAGLWHKGYSATGTLALLLRRYWQAQTSAIILQHLKCCDGRRSDEVVCACLWAGGCCGRLEFRPGLDSQCGLSRIFGDRRWF